MVCKGASSTRTTRTAQRGTIGPTVTVTTSAPKGGPDKQQAGRSTRASPAPPTVSLRQPERPRRYSIDTDAGSGYSFALAAGAAAASTRFRRGAGGVPATFRVGGPTAKLHGYGPHLRRRTGGRQRLSGPPSRITSRAPTGGALEATSGPINEGGRPKRQVQTSASGEADPSSTWTRPRRLHYRLRPGSQGDAARLLRAAAGHGPVRRRCPFGHAAHTPSYGPHPRQVEDGGSSGNIDHRQCLQRPEPRPNEQTRRTNQRGQQQPPRFPASGRCDAGPGQPSDTAAGFHYRFAREAGRGGAAS